MVTLLAIALLSAPDGKAIVKTARGYLGYPYVYGDEGRYGFDCSGFVQTVYAGHGLKLPRTARLQSKVGEPVRLDSLRAGDLVFFNPNPSSNRITHVGVATGDGQVIHASSGRGEVVIDPLAGYWTRHGAEGRRILGTPFAPLAETPADRRREHVRPVSRSLGSSSKPGLWHKGAVDLDRRDTSFGLRTGTLVNSDRKPLLWLSPIVQIRWDPHDTEIALQIPFAYTVDGESQFDYGTGQDALRLVDRVRVGTPDASLYVNASRDVSLSLGDQSLVDGVTPNASTRSLAGFPTRAPFALATQASLDHWRGAWVMDDIVEPTLVGARIERRGALDLFAEVLGDPNASDRGRLVATTTARFQILGQRRWGTKIYASTSAFGTATISPLLRGGVTLRISPSPLEVEIEGELRSFRSGAAPDLFGIDYRAQSSRGIWNQLDDESDAEVWQNGFRLRALAAFTRRLAIRAAWSATSNDDTLGQDQLELSLIVREWEVSPHLLGSMALGYHQRFVQSLAAARFGDDKELLFASARVRHSNGFSVGAQLARRPIDGQPEIDVLVDASFSSQF